MMQRTTVYTVPVTAIHGSPFLLSTKNVCSGAGEVQNLFHHNIFVMDQSHILYGQLRGFPKKLKFFL